MAELSAATRLAAEFATIRLDRIEGGSFDRPLWRSGLGKRGALLQGWCEARLGLYWCFI